MSLPSMFEFICLLSSLATILSAVLAVKAKEDFYAAILLGITGLLTASLLALIGYGFIAVFHALVYVGATVMFVIFGVVLIGRTGGVEKKAFLPAILASTLLAISLLALFLEVQAPGASFASLDLNKLQALLFQENPMAVLFLAFSLVVLVISGLMLASGEGRGEEEV